MEIRTKFDDGGRVWEIAIWKGKWCVIGQYVTYIIRQEFKMIRQQLKELKDGENENIFGRTNRNRRS